MPPKARTGVWKAAIFIAALLVLTALWQWGPLADLLDPHAWDSLQDDLKGAWYGPVGGVAAYVVLGLLLAPHMALIAVTDLVFGPYAGFVVSVLGGLLSAAANYSVGARLGRRQMLERTGGRLHRLSTALGGRGIEAMIAARLLPIAPFALVSYTAGASHIRFRDFMVGTLLGIVPLTIGVTFLTEQFASILKNPSIVDIALQIVLAVVIGAIAVFGTSLLRRHLRRRREHVAGMRADLEPDED